MAKKKTEPAKVLRGELAKILGMRVTTICFYMTNDLIPYSQEESRCKRYFDVEEVRKVIDEIDSLKAKGKSIREIKAMFRKDKGKSS